MDAYRLNRHMKREQLRNESIFEGQSDSANKAAQLRAKFHALPKMTQKLLLKQQQSHSLHLAEKPKSTIIVTEKKARNK